MKIKREFKYVVINGAYPIVFSHAQTHSEFREIGKITSAGFGQINDDQTVSVWGNSQSLKIGTDKIDHILLEALFWQHWA